MRVITIIGCAAGFTSCVALAQSQSAAIYACVGSTGVIQIVSPGTACKKNETLLTWNVAGPQGPPGPTLPTTAFTADNFSGGFSAEAISTDALLPTEVAGFNLPPGNYVVTGVVGLHATIPLGTLVPFANVQCSLHNGAEILGTDFRTLVGGATSSFASLPVTASFSVAVASTVTVACIADSGPQVLTQPTTLTAIQVGTLTRQ